jgi:para-aminobenzoate synthetase component 1
MTDPLQIIETTHTPESLVERLRGERGVVLLRSRMFESLQARYSFVTARPFLTFCSWGSKCKVTHCSQEAGCQTSEPNQFGNPWHILDALLARYELLDEADQPLPLGGCFGFFGYDLKKFVEPKLRVRSLNDLELPDCHLGFYDSLVAFDHQLGKTLIIATGLGADGSRTTERQKAQLDFWKNQLQPGSGREGSPLPAGSANVTTRRARSDALYLRSTFTRKGFIAAVEAAQRYIRSGDIYQVNLTQRLSADWSEGGWSLFERLADVSPAPFSAFLDCGEFQLASSSPELFLRLSGSHIQTRPIKGTRPRSHDAAEDSRLSYELQISPKEQAELVMITDLLRNDLGRVCEFGSVQVPDLLRLEKYAQVQHLVSTVEGRLRKDVTHLAALASCFPGGSITGAPKFRAMEVIDELEPVSRGPYCGALGYLGFNRESQLSIVIRTAICQAGVVHFPVGAGIVTDSDPAAEYEETLAKARGFMAALQHASGKGVPPVQVETHGQDARATAARTSQKQSA